jgi:hypothetical protein
MTPPLVPRRRRVSRRTLTAGLAGVLGAAAAATSAPLPPTAYAGVVAPRAARSPVVAGAYTQVTVDGQRTGLGFEGVEHALVAYAAMHRVTGDAHQRTVFEALLEYVLARRPTHMGSLLGVQVLSDPFLLAHAQLMANLDRHAATLVQRFADDPDRLLRTGDIRTLAGNASFLTAYARHHADPGTAGGGGDSGRSPAATLVRAADPNDVDMAATALLDRLVDLQLTLPEAIDRFDNPRLVGGFPHLVEGPDGSMGAWDVRTWSPAMLSLDQYAGVRALADGFGRYGRPAYERGAAAAARPLLSTTAIDPDLLYAGSPAGFPLDGAEFAFGEETGEMPYLLSYGWSPNAVADLGTALRAVLANRVSVPRSRPWAELYWRDEPPQGVLDRTSFHAGLAAKIAFTHRFVEATQLPVPPEFPWIDLERTTFPGTGDDDIHRGGWYDGSGRGAMSAVYSRIAVHGYVASGGADSAMLGRAGRWWDAMIVWE